jgi:hypothetical protein
MWRTVLVVLLALSVTARIFTLDDKVTIAPFTNYANGFQSGLYSKTDPMMYISLFPATGDPYAKLEFSVSTEQETENPFQVIFGKASEFYETFDFDAEGKLKCENGKAKIIGPMGSSISIVTKDLPANFHSQVQVRDSDFYVVILSKCAEASNASINITLNGQLVFMNPFGHLSGQQFGIMPV